MCVSAVVETDLSWLASKLGLERLSPAAGRAGDELHRRIEARDEAWVVRGGSAGRLAVEPMAYKPYVLRRRNIGGDMWASSLLDANHGLIVLKSFAEWVSADLMLSQGLIEVHDANCAFTRAMGGPMGRLLLVNFTPAQPLLVPVFFDRRRDGEGREFVLIADEPAAALRFFGLAQAPLSLAGDLALEWLTAEGAGLAPLDEGPLATGDESGGGGAQASFAVDFEEMLEEGRTETFAFSLFKSA